MPDLTQEILPLLRANQLPGLDSGYEFIYPFYDGLSLLNVPTSICRWLGVPDIMSKPLIPLIGKSLNARYQNVILTLVDALSFSTFQQLLNERRLPLSAELVGGGVMAPLTSITPSTTVAALTSLWTGQSAAQHGLVGYEMWMKEYGMVVNTILLAPSSFIGDAGSLQRAGLEPENLIAGPTLGSHLTDHGVHVYAYQHQSIAHSALSRMLLQDVKVNSFRTSADLWVNVRQMLENTSRTHKYIWIYWGEADNFSHHFGPGDERTTNEIMNFFAALQSLFIDRLNSQIARDTLLIILADHGQIETQPDPKYDIKYHPDLIRNLHIMPTGENRLAYLHHRPGQGERNEEYIRHTWPGQFVFLSSARAVESGLFGSGEGHHDLFDRLGDGVVIARENAYLWWSSKNNHLLGRHGGLSPKEMLVPFLAVNL